MITVTPERYAELLATVRAVQLDVLLRLPRQVRGLLVVGGDGHGLAAEVCLWIRLPAVRERTIIRGLRGHLVRGLPVALCR